MNNDKDTYALIGAAMTVHRELGHGFLEHVYQEAMALELQASKIPFNKEVNVDIYYRGQKLTTNYRADFICFGSIIIELKAVNQLTPNHEAQMLNYLTATKLERGLLINFGAPSLEFKRLVWTHAS